VHFSVGADAEMFVAKNLSCSDAEMQALYREVLGLGVTAPAGV
jgi:hypothetical protein